MAFTDDQKALLIAELDRDRIKGREGPGGRTLSYLSQDDVKRCANEIFGHGRWGYETLELVLIAEEEVKRVRGEGDQRVEETGLRVAYRAHVKAWVADEPGTYTDWGYGEDISYTSTVQQHELAVKEAVSDAVKRALAALGNQFGLQLYHEAAAARGGNRAGSRPARGKAADPPKPATLNDSDLRAIHAHRNEMGVSEADMKRLMRFVADMPSLESSKDFPRSFRGDLRDAIDFFASNPAGAEEQLSEFESGSAPALAAKA